MDRNNILLHANRFTSSAKKIEKLDGSLSFLPGRNIANVIARFWLPTENYCFFYYIGNLGASSGFILRRALDFALSIIAIYLMIYFFDFFNRVSVMILRADSSYYNVLFTLLKIFIFMLFCIMRITYSISLFAVIKGTILRSKGVLHIAKYANIPNTGNLNFILMAMRYDR